MTAAVATLTVGCASSPNSIDAAYVSPGKYAEYDCQQIAAEVDNVSHRTNVLYSKLKKERNADNAQMAVGLVLFWPALFFLEGGDGPEATEYAQMKGNLEALRSASVMKKCGMDIPSIEDMVKK